MYLGLPIWEHPVQICLSYQTTHNYSADLDCVFASLRLTVTAPVEEAYQTSAVSCRVNSTMQRIELTIQVQAAKSRELHQPEESNSPKLPLWLLG